MTRQINNIVDRRYLKELRKARAVLKYLLNRNDAGQRMTREMYLQRIVDRGLGVTWQDILAALGEGESPYVLMWMHVLSPDPLVQQLLPVNQRKQAIGEMAELYITTLYEALGFEQPLFTMMIHDSTASNNLQRFHAHIVLQGTCPDLESGMPRNVFIEKRKGHFEVSDQAREAALDQVMSRRVGLDWKDRIPALPGSLEDWEAQLVEVEQAVAAVPSSRPSRDLSVGMLSAHGGQMLESTAPAPEVESPDLDFSL